VTTRSPGPVRIALYGEINMNLIDGSSVWLQSVAQMLTVLPQVEVTLLLRAPIERELLTNPLDEHPGIELVDPSSFTDSDLVTPMQALDALERLDRERPFDVVLLRGAAVAERAASRSAFPGRLWVYYLPPHEFAPGAQVDHLRLIAEAADRVLCQTEPIRDMAAAIVPDQAAKLTLLPPMIPEPIPTGEEGTRARGERPLRLLYAGKFAPEYYFLEMIATFERLRRAHPDAELHLVGDKIHDPRDDPAFKPAAEAALAETEGVIWHGGVARERVPELLAEADVALSIRHPMMDKELATKVLEYGAAGCAVLLNRTPLYERLLGADYPLFATDPGEALAVLQRVADDPGLRESAAERCASAAALHTFERVAAGLEPSLG
jgi:glycosyltransferase involved in cell wall biosynthesis